MSQPTDSRRLDPDRIDTGSRRSWRTAVAAIVAGLVLGGAVGLVVGLTRPDTATAGTALSVLPDSTVSTDTSSSLDQDATAFIQAQLVVLNGDQLKASVRQQLGLGTTPDVSSAQVGQTYVVQVTATAPTQTEANAVATATASAYSSLRTGQLSASLDTRIAQVNSQLASVQQALAAASPTTATGNVSPTASALQVQYQQLLQTANALTLAKTQVASVVTVLTPAAAVTPSALSGARTAIVLGAILGAVVAVVVLLAVRRFSPRVRSVGDLTALGVPALLPVLSTRGRRGARGASAWRSNAGRLLAARLSGRQGARQEPLVVVGATPGVGTSHVAASLAAGMVERGPVLLVLATDLVHGADARTLRGLSATDVSADIDLEPAADLAEEVIRRAVQCEIPGVWVLPMGTDVVAEVGPLPSARARLLVDVLARATGAGWQVVVDAPALSDSDLGVDTSTAGRGAVVLVVARGVSRPADVVSASELFDVKGSRFRGAILNERPGRFRRRSGPAAAEGLQVAFEPPSLERADGGGAGNASDTARRRSRRRVPPPARAAVPGPTAGAAAGPSRRPAP